MKHFQVNQLKHEINVPTTIVRKIYNNIIAQEKTEQQYDGTTNFDGEVTINNPTYLHWVTKIQQTFPIKINASEYYVYFDDPILNNICIELYSSDHIGVKQNDLDKVTNIQDLINHSLYNNIEILDLSKFTNFNENIGRHLPTSCKRLYLNNCYTIFFWDWKYYAENLEYVYVNKMGSQWNSPNVALFVSRDGNNENIMGSTRVHNNTIVVGGFHNNFLNANERHPFASFQWWSYNTVENLYLNIDKYFDFYFTYGSMSYTVSNYNNEGVKNLYVPESIYNEYVQGWGGFCQNINVYNFDIDPNNVMLKNN